MTVSCQHRALAVDGSGVGRHVRLMLQQIDVPGIVQVDLRVILGRALQSAYRFKSVLQGLQAALEILTVIRDSGAAHVPLRPVPRSPQGVHVVDRGTLTRMLRAFRHVQIADQFWLGHFNAWNERTCEKKENVYNTWSYKK